MAGVFTRPGSTGGLSGVQSTPAMPLLPTVCATIRQSGRNGRETLRHTATQKNVDEGQAGIGSCNVP